MDEDVTKDTPKDIRISESESDLVTEELLPGEEDVFMTSAQAAFVFGDQSVAGSIAASRAGWRMRSWNAKPIYETREYRLTKLQRDKLEAFMVVDLRRSQQAEAAKAAPEMRELYQRAGVLVFVTVLGLVGVLLAANFVLFGLSARGDTCLLSTNNNSTACYPISTNTLVGVVTGLSIGFENLCTGVIAAIASSPFVVTNIFFNCGGFRAGFVLVLISWVCCLGFDVVIFIATLSEPHSETFTIVALSLCIGGPVLGALVGLITSTHLKRAQTRYG